MLSEEDWQTAKDAGISISTAASRGIRLLCSNEAQPMEALEEFKHKVGRLAERLSEQSAKLYEAEQRIHSLERQIK